MVRTRGKDGEWLGAQNLAVILGVSVVYFRDRLAPLTKDGESKRHAAKGPALEYHAPSLIRAWIAEKEAMAVAKVKAKAVPTDPLLVGDGESPGLERYRRARAQREELLLDRDRGDLAHVGRLEGYLRQAMGVVRGAIERLQREFGPVAYEIMAEAVMEADRRIATMAEEYGRVASGNTGDDVTGSAADGVGDAPAEAADDERVRGGGDRDS